MGLESGFNKRKAATELPTEPSRRKFLEAAVLAAGYAILPKVGKSEVVVPEVPAPSERVPFQREVLTREEQLERDKAFQREKIEVARGLVTRSESMEVFKFPGIKHADYVQMKRDWEEEPEYAVDIDRLLKRFFEEGIKIVFSNDPTSGNIFIMPAKSVDIQSDSLLPRMLSHDDIEDYGLRLLSIMEHVHNQEKISQRTKQ